ncbi:MAG: lactate utilization protein [Ruminococcus sp.]|nr:lactate utilization protein [Ruminococcus sp.]
MDNNLKTTYRKRLEKTARALEKNYMKAFVADTCEEACEIVRGLLKDGEQISCGGSMTLNECGVMDIMRSGKYDFLDRAKAATPDEVAKIYRAAFSCDSYLSSSNAITENGELYNVDGNCNRVAAITFGPKQVIIVAGRNKVVRDLPAAIDYVKRVSAPANAVRLSLDTPCSELGECAGANIDNMCSGCKSDKRICCGYVVTGYQRDPERVKVVLVNEELGY